MIIRENEPMALHTSFRVGGPARYFIKAETLTDLNEAIAFTREKDIPLFVLGNGTNLLVSDSGYDGAVITLSGDFSAIEHSGELNLKVGAATPLGRFARTSMKMGIGCIHKLAGIPGTLGGAIYMNAGAYGQEVGTHCTKVTTIDKRGNIHERDNAACQFGYRQSAFQKAPEEIILSAEFAFPDNAHDTAALERELQECMAKRKATQPLNMPNAGSTFKRLATGAPETPQQIAPGYYIEQTGLKGYRIGGAQVSTVHANFIVNAGGATAQDILSLANYIQEKVHEKFGILLQREIIVLGK